MENAELIVKVTTESESIDFYRTKEGTEYKFFLITNEKNEIDDDMQELQESNLYDSLEDLWEATISLYPLFMLKPEFIHNDYKEQICELLNAYAISKGIMLKSWKKALEL